MQVERTKRRFFYLGLELPDINERLTPEQIRDAYCTKSQNQNLLASPWKRA
jgi:PRTRC genetic system protein C